MNSRWAALAALAAVVAGPPAAEGMLANVALEIITTRSELIVVAEVVEAGQAARLRLKVPDSPKAVDTWFRRCKLTVTRVIKEDPPAAKPAKKSQAARKIDVLARAQRPQKPGEPVLRVANGNYPNLRVGQSYVLILRKMPGKTEYYLPSYPKNYGRATKDRIARIEKAANVDKWPWGKAVNGLQIALVPSRPVVNLMTVRQSVRGPDGQMGQPVTKKLAYVQAVVALRNTSKKALAVNLYMGDGFLKVEGTGPAGKTVSPDLYGFLAAMGLAGPQAKDVAKIEPGKVMFINARGQTKYGGGGHPLPLSPGKWKFKASYTSVRKANVKGGKLWTGKIESAAADVEVKEARRKPARAQIRAHKQGG